MSVPKVDCSVQTDITYVSEYKEIGDKSQPSIEIGESEIIGNSVPKYSDL